jgi:transglutaminase-like putative cysteine protease
MNRYHLVHITEFSYDTPVTESYNEVRLRPMEDDRQSCISFRLVTWPTSRGLAYRDALGNWVHHFNVLPGHRHLKVEAESVVLAHDAPASVPCAMSLAQLDALDPGWCEDQIDFLTPTAYVPLLPEVAELQFEAELRGQGSVAGFAQAASDLIHEKFRYVKGATHVHSSICDSLVLGAGVCQDFAHLLLAVVRMRGLPARYVSGYLVPESAAAPQAKQAKLEAVIGGHASHAWVEAYLPDSGWVAYDPTLGNPVGLRHVRIAYGRDYGDVVPVRGVYRGRSGQRLSVDVKVRPALDDEGHEQVSDVPKTAPVEEVIVTRPHQPQQQQQQQQQ